MRALARAGGLLPATLVLLCSAPAAANEFDDFQKARSAYDVQDYQQAAVLFVELVGGAVPRLTTRSLVIESRKYLAASYIFLGYKDKAALEFERLLREEQDYVLDPLAFPAATQTAFNDVKRRLTRERVDAEAARQQAAEQAAENAAGQQKAQTEQLRRLYELAKTERVEERRSRWIAMVPFGVGQFQNGHDDLGLVLAISEATLLAAGVTTFVLHENLRNQKPSAAKLNDAEFAERAYRLTNQVSLGLFAVIAITGIIDANLRFRDTETYERERKLPPELEGLKLSIGPGAIGVSGKF